MYVQHIELSTTKTGHKITILGLWLKLQKTNSQKKKQATTKDQTTTCVEFNLAFLCFKLILLYRYFDIMLRTTTTTKLQLNNSESQWPVVVWPDITQTLHGGETIQEVSRTWLSETTATNAILL